MTDCSEGAWKTWTWEKTLLAEWLIQFRSDSSLSSESGGGGSSLLLSEKDWTCREHSGEGWKLSAWVVLTVEGKVRALPTSVDKGHWSSTTSRAKQAGAPGNLQVTCFNFTVTATSSFNRATFKVIVPFRGVKTGDPFITKTVYVSTRASHAVLSNDKISVAVTSYPGNRRNVDSLHRCSGACMRFKSSRNQLEGGITGWSRIWFAFFSWLPSTRLRGARAHKGVSPMTLVWTYSANGILSRA